MGRFRPPVLTGGLAMIGVVAASAIFIGIATGSGGPLVAGGDFEHWGGGQGHAGGGAPLAGIWIGCGITHHYVYALTVRNRSSKAVTLLGASAPDPAPRIISPLAMQFRRWQPPVGRGFSGALITKWSAGPAKPLTLRAGQGAVVQTNFVIRNCRPLTHGRTVKVPGKLTLRYRLSGKTATQRITRPELGLILGPGPRFRTCSPPPGALKLHTSNLRCAVARAAAPACQRYPDHGNFKPCSYAGHVWRCRFAAVYIEQCGLAGTSAQRYRPEYTVRWKPHKIH